MSEKVLIVDPDLEDREFVSSIMRDQGWEVLKAITMKDGILYLRSHDISLVLCNNLIPTMVDGQRFINEVRKVSDTIYIVVVSPVKAKSAIVDLINIGANDYLVKPIDRDTLLWKLSIHFKAITIKDFARINIPADPELSQCYFDVKGTVGGLGEGFIDLFLSYRLEPDMEFKMDPSFFRVMGIEKQMVNLKVSEVHQLREKIGEYSFVARCQIMEMSDEETILIRRWLFNNYKV
ncbi:MAG: response regulator [Oligoflexia bacterium]|nr:response regulator [Oligoflexia bacterium]